MATGCPICDQPIPPGATRCAACGFPTALALDALRLPLSDDVPETAPSGAPGPVIVVAAAPDPQEGLCDRIGRQIDVELGALAELGGDPLAVASEVRQAALSQAEGRSVEALGILRQAHQRAVAQTDEMFAARVAELAATQARLRDAGFRVDFEAEIAGLRDGAEPSARAASLRRLAGLHDRIGRLESEWNGLQGLLGQIDTLREAAARYGVAVPQVDEDVTRVRDSLARAASAATLDEAGPIAARALMLLHESLPPHLEAELGAHASTLDGYPSETVGASEVRAIHADAVRHLRRGRLPEAAVRLRELRAALADLERRHGPRSAPAVPEPAAAATVDVDAALPGLLSKARGLAARVRTLPAESELAFEAAGEIRRATELLRARKVEEADLTLSRLMRLLATERAVEA